MTDQPGPQRPTPAQGARPQGGTTSSGPRGLWDGAVSTTGGRVAVVVAALSVAFVLVASLGLTAFAVGRHVMDDGRGRVAFDDREGPGSGVGPGHGIGKGQGNGRNKEKGRSNGKGAPGGLLPGVPRGQGMGQGGIGLGGALHGELTTADAAGQPVTTLFQVGEVTAYTAGESVAVRSADGFEATYVITGDTVTTRAAVAAVGAQVRVLALKEGLVLTRVTVVERPQG